MGHEFRCRSGECADCRTRPDIIPITIGDIVRARVYEYPRFPGPYDVFKEYASGWATTKAPGLFAAFEGRIFDKRLWDYWPIAASKRPCAYLDAEKKVCKGHGTVKYLTCNVMPELLLIGEAKEPEHDLADLDCLEGASLSPEAQKKILAINSRFVAAVTQASVALGYGEMDGSAARLS